MNFVRGAVGVAILGLFGAVAFGCNNPSQSASVDAEPIGNGINRTDDRERGVSCYRTVHGGTLSCVYTGIGKE